MEAEGLRCFDLSARPRLRRQTQILAPIRLNQSCAVDVRLLGPPAKSVPRFTSLLHLKTLSLTFIFKYPMRPLDRWLAHHIAHGHGRYHITHLLNLET